ncbi:MAG: ABC transporter substrate-binding protein [Deltaproteobacteria bacterium]|nr:MAG: ABC transporter substrate-binding protein [Deltaproteobacteria bacterium]
MYPSTGSSGRAWTAAGLATDFGLGPHLPEVTVDISLACSPDADDLFMVRALLEGLIDTGPYTFAIEASPTDALNRLGDSAAPDVLAISIAHYPKIADTYQMLPHGGSMGEGYGPVLVAREPMSLADLEGRKVAIPGTTTTAWAVLQRMVDVQPVVTPITPYSLIFDALRSGEVDAGLIIHEGRLTYEDEGFVRVAELGEWWDAHTGGLPLPLGGNCIRRSLGEEHIAAISELYRQSIRHALEHQDEAVAWLLERGSKLQTPEKVREYLGMYANGRTLDYGEDGRQAIEHLLDMPVDFAP